MKALFCSYDKPGNVGGPFSWLRRLMPALRDRGIESEALFLTHFGGTGPVIESLLDDGFRCTVVNCHERTAEQTRWILDQVRINPPDVFVPNLVVSAYHAARWVRKAGIPTVGILHSDDAYYRAIQDEFVFGTGQNQLAGVVCVSEELESQVRARHPESTDVRRIPYGVPVPKESVSHDDRPLRIVYVGRLAEEQKQISKLTKAFIRVSKAIPGLEAVIYGDGPDKGHVEEILESEGKEARVSLGGNVPNDEIQNVLQQHDAIVLLSDYEGLPIALLEAMACGCVPVCLSMKSGIPELLEGSNAGLMVTDRHDSFLNAIRRLATDSDLKQTLSANARQLIIEKYSDESSANNWADYLGHLSNSKASVAPLNVPRHITLAKRNPALESAAKRAASPSRLSEFLRKSRMAAGRIRRQLLPGQHDQ